MSRQQNRNRKVIESVRRNKAQGHQRRRAREGNARDKKGMAQANT
jgi:hypothetical protein